MPVAPNTRLGPYRILSPLGTGGMGEVYRARDTRLNRDVAIKVLPGHLQDSPDVGARFEREARTVSGLNHPHICVLHDIGREGDIGYMVMELLEGDTLARRLARGPLAPSDVAMLGGQIASALGRAHRAGVVHRDLKPGNIMLTKAGAKLMDFGVARSIGAAVDRSAGDVPRSEPSRPGAVDDAITSDGAVVGTVQYMAPEQIAGREADARSDIWALGCVLYEMATGRRAFEGPNSAAVVSAILHEVPRPMVELAPRTTPALERVVMQCLTKDPDDRWQSAEDLARALSGMEGPSGGITAAARPGRHRATGKVLSILGVAVALAAMFVAWQATRAGGRRLTFTPLTYRPMTVLDAGFAPDGRSVIFDSAVDGGPPRLYLRRPESPALEPLGVPGLQLLSVSSRGELAVLTRFEHLKSDVAGTLARMPLGGGSPREILQGVRSADWSPDGSHLAVVRNDGAGDRIEYPIGTVLCRYNGWMDHLRVSPRGDRIAFIAHAAPADTRGSVRIVDLRGEQKILTEDYYSMDGLAWSANGKEILFSASDGVTPSKVYSVSPNGSQRLVLEVAGGQTIQDVNREGIWLTTRDDRRSRVFAHKRSWERERDLSWLSESGDGSFSADGSTFVFTEFGSAAGSYYAVCLRKPDGAPPTRLGDGSAFGASRDGKWVLAGIASTPAQLVAYPAGPGPTRRLDPGTFDSFSMAWWSSNGDSLVFVGREKGRPSRFFVQGVSGGAPRAVTPEGTSRGVPAWDSPEILAAGSDGRYAIYPRDGGAPRPVGYVDTTEHVVGWSARKRVALVITRSFTVPCRVKRVSLATGRRSTAFVLTPSSLEGLTNLSFIWISSDARSYSYSLEQVLSTVFLVKGGT